MLKSGIRPERWMRGMSRAAQACRSLSRSYLLLCGVGPLALCGAAGVAAENEVDLIGTWHVTVHFRDAASEQPEADRWDDKVWRFERRGSRLLWTEFPVVVFARRAGRFEAHDENRESRILHYWEPDEEQLAEIREGLRVSPYGTRSKTLRGSPGSGYESVGVLRAESASVIGYSESWSIAGLPTKPIFTREAVMGSESVESIHGRTRYGADRVSDHGDEVRGTFERDGTRHGRFAMRRVGELTVMGGGADRRKRSSK